MKTDRQEGIAIVAVTRKGAVLGRRLRELLPGSHLYLPEKFAAETGPDERVFSRPLKEVVREAFAGYRYLVLIMAVGIAVRLVAAELRDKRQDPAVVVVDDAGLFSISLLSGHIGGANDLARKVASLLGAQPVVTTASDINGAIPVDTLGREYGWELEDDAEVTAASAALVNGEPVGIYQDAGESYWWPESEPMADNIRFFASLDDLERSGSKAVLIISDRILNKEQLSLPAHTVIYRPKSLVIGIGCNRGTGCEQIEPAASRALSESGLSPKSLRHIATIDIKKNEPGLLEFARKYGLPVEYYDKDALRRVKFPPSPSAMVLRHTGTASVCEAAALLSAGGGPLVVPKASFDRAVTIAVTRYNTTGKMPQGKLSLVGIGPGSLEQMTIRAKEAIAGSEVVVGYESYIDLIKPLLGQKEVIATGMGAEVARVTRALSLAKKGRKVALVSSGDTGIYGMAGLVGEVRREQTGNGPDVEVIPGVPLLAASAALLGSPITGDFASVSLSDYLLSWKEISQRIRLAVRGDFVIVIYNPRSRKRHRQLGEVREIILRYRPPQTPVGIVTGAYRPGREVTITDLGHMLEHKIGMNTTIIIGNSTTFVHDNWMVTPRGYRKKYSLSGEEE